MKEKKRKEEKKKGVLKGVQDKTLFFFIWILVLAFPINDFDNFCSHSEQRQKKVFICFKKSFLSLSLSLSFFWSDNFRKELLNFKSIPDRVII